MTERDTPRPRIRAPHGLAAYVPEYLDLTRHDVDAAIADGSLAAWWTLGHNLRGSARSFGFEEVETLGKEIEEHAARGSAEQALACARKLREYLDRVEVDEN